MSKASHIISSFKLPIQFVLLLWVIHIVQFLTQIDFPFLFGTYPREIFGLRGVVFSPLIHGDFHHLFSNSLPLLFTSIAILMFYKRVAVRAMIMIYLLTGLAVWGFARPVFHIGASGVVYGFVSFIFWTGVFRRNIKSIVLALIVTFLYSGYIMGILPNQEGISWESHLLGAIVGIFTSYWYKDEIEVDEEEKIPSWEQDRLNGIVEEEKYFLNRDAFEKTKQERLKEQQNENRLW
jgi:membrane associated rhomboid family serine protease